MKKHEKVPAQIDKWNAAYPPGTEVLLRDNSGTLVPTKTRSVACVLIQAAAGCGTASEAFALFDQEHWLTSPTPGMRTIAGTMDQWRGAAKMTADTWGEAHMRPQEFAQLGRDKPCKTR